MEIKYIEETTLEDRLKYLSEEPFDFWTFYLVSFTNRAYKTMGFERYFKDYNDFGRYGLEDDKNIYLLYKGLIQRSYIHFYRVYTNEDDGTRHNFWSLFYKEEKSEAESLKDKNSLAHEYYNFLLESLNKIKTIFYYFYGYYNRNKKAIINFINYATPKLGDDFIKINTYQEVLQKIFEDLDDTYLKSLLENKTPKSSEVLETINESIDLQELAFPIIFMEYPKELVVYKKMIKNWLLMEVEKRKRQFNWEENNIPMPFLEITKFANRLLDAAERDYLIKDSPEYYQYPKHIFSGFKGYKLFEYYSKGIYNQTMLTFIYRNMRSNEREEYKILADPAPFLEWYNSQREHDNIFQINQPLSKVNSKERQQNYKIIKSLIEELYPTT